MNTMHFVQVGSSLAKKGILQTFLYEITFWNRCTNLLYTFFIVPNARPYLSRIRHDKNLIPECQSENSLISVLIHG